MLEGKKKGKEKRGGRRKAKRSQSGHHFKYSTTIIGRGRGGGKKEKEGKEGESTIYIFVFPSFEAF